MTRRKTPVIGWMPIASRNHHVELTLQPIGDRQHLVAVRNGQCSARQKVILNIDKDQRAAGGIYRLTIHGSTHISKLNPFLHNLWYFRWSNRYKRAAR